MTIWVWVLTYTVLGVNPEHRTFSKYETQQECEQALISLKQEKKLQNKNIVGSCVLTLKEKNSGKS